MNNYTPTPSYDDYLMHFGILGQRWGKKNGPPYPLGTGDHSAAEKKAGYTKSKEGKRNTKLYSDGGSSTKKELTRNQRFGVSAANAGVSAAFAIQGAKSIKEGDKALGTAQLAVGGLAAANSAANLIKGMTTPKNKQNTKIDGKTIKELNRNPEAKSQKIIDDINNNSEYKEALNKYSELSKKYSQEFNNKLKDPKVIKKAEEDYKKTRGTNKVDKKDPIYDYVLRNVAAGDYEDDPRYDKKVRAEATKAFKKDYGKDADPLNNKHYDYYIEEAASKLNWKPKRVKSETEKAFDKSIDNLINVQNKVVNDYLGSYANQTVGKSTRTYSDIVNSMMLDDRTNKRGQK